MDRRRGRDVNTNTHQYQRPWGACVLTREAAALRVTMMIGHTGLYFETMRADEPLLAD